MVAESDVHVDEDDDEADEVVDEADDDVDEFWWADSALISSK